MSVRVLLIHYNKLRSLLIFHSELHSLLSFMVNNTAYFSFTVIYNLRACTDSLADVVNLTDNAQVMHYMPS